MSLPNHYPLQFPYEDSNYLDALVHDYLELMGELPEQRTSIPNNNLLVEYGTSGMPQDENGERTGEG